MARSETNEAGRLIASGIGLARPKHAGHYGYISEHHGYGMSEAEIGEYVEDLAASMLASTSACASTGERSAWIPASAS